MAQLHQNAATVPLAHGGPITDNALDQLINAAEALERGQIDEIAGEFLIQNLRGVLIELKQRRAVMGTIATMADLGNVVVMSEHRT